MIKDTIYRVIDCVATTTRYPIELLVADADLEDDLGIDSVKRLEIVVALADEFGLELNAEQRDPSVRTIGNIATWIDALLSRNRSGKQSRNRISDTPPNDSREQSFNARDTAYRHGHLDSTKDEHQRYRRQDAASPSLSEQHSSQQHSKVRRSDLPSAGPLAGRVALVTGSGHGVGCTIARVLASRGAAVVINSFHSREQGEQTAAEIRSHGHQAMHVWGSVANPDHVEEIFSHIEHQFGQLDVLVCNASDGRIGPFLELSPEDWDRAFRTNVSGHYHCAVRAAGLMRASGGGSIVTMSAVGSHGFIDGLGSQGVVKAAVETLTRYLACELGQHGIRVNCVAGGPVYGELLSKFPEAQAAQNHWECLTPDGQLCSPLDLANAIAFLVSDEARGINGSVWMVDHGFSATADGRSARNTRRGSFQPSLV